MTHVLIEEETTAPYHCEKITCMSPERTGMSRDTKGNANENQSYEEK